MVKVGYFLEALIACNLGVVFPLVIPVFKELRNTSDLVLFIEAS